MAENQVAHEGEEWVDEITLKGHDAPDIHAGIMEQAQAGIRKHPVNKT